MAWFKRQRTHSEDYGPLATNAQVGYMLSLMDELDVDSLEITVEDPRTGETVVQVVDEKQVSFLRKGDASQVITQLLRAKEGR